MFKQLFESPFRTGPQGKNAFSKEYEWDNTYKNSQFVKLIDDNFTAKKYKIYKSQGSMFVVDKKDNYKLSIEFDEAKSPKILRVNTAHSNEPQLFGKFVLYMLKFYEYVSSGNKQSAQAEKSWKKIIKKANKVYSDVGEMIPIDKTKTMGLYNTPSRIAISETVMFGRKFSLFENEYYMKIAESPTFRSLIENNPSEADYYLYALLVKG